MAGAGLSLALFPTPLGDGTMAGYRARMHAEGKPVGMTAEEADEEALNTGANSAAGGGSEDPDNNRKDKNKDKNRSADGDKPAPDKTGKDFGRRIGKELGEDARQEFHYMKEKGAPDRSLNQLKQDASDLFR